MRTKQFIMSKVVTKLLNHWTYLMQLCCVLTDRDSFKWLDMRSRAINISSFCLLNERMLDALLPLNSGENNYKKLTRLDAKTSWRLALEFGGMWTCVIFSMGLGSSCQSQMTNCHPSIIDKCGSARLLFSLFVSCYWWQSHAMQPQFWPQDRDPIKLHNMSSFIKCKV